MRASVVGLSVKAHLVTGFVDVLKSRGHLSKIEPFLEPETRALIESRPLATKWIDGRFAAELHFLTHQLVGVAELRECSHLATQRSAVRVMLPFVEATLRLFGASPASLFHRIDQFVCQSTRGVAASFVSTGDRSGVVTFRYTQCRLMPISTLEGAAGALRSAFDVTRTDGTFHAIRWTDDERNVGELDLSWRPR